MLPRRIVTFFESRKLTEAPETSSNGISSTGHFERMFNDYVRLRVQSSLKKSRPDAIIVVYADLGYVLDGLALNCLKVVDTIDVMHLQNKSYTKWGIEKPYIISQEEERTALKRFDIVIAIQDQEKIVFQKLCPDKQVITILPWLQVKRVSTKSNTEKNILFLGFNNSFNIHGINKFLAEIWPDVLLAQPEAKLLIGGKISGEIDASQYRNVECLGFFKDLDDFYRLGEITINPVVAGSGIKIKTLEALTRGKICISSSHSAEGLDTFIGHGLDIADTNEEFVTQLTKYMTDSNLRNMKIEDALNIARQTVSVENCLEPLLKYLN
ncbi:MAG: glycosyltransferase [Lentisphaerota bacterium]